MFIIIVYDFLLYLSSVSYMLELISRKMLILISIHILFIILFFSKSRVFVGIGQ